MGAVGITSFVAVGDIVAITLFSGLGQALADHAEPVTAPWWLEPAWLLAFFPSFFALFLPHFNHPMGLGANDHVVWGFLTLFNGAIWGVTVYMLLRWASRNDNRAALVKTGFRLSSVIFVWFWVTSAALHLIDLNYLRGSDASTFGSPFFAPLAIIIAGVTYAALFGPLTLRMLGNCSLGRQINVARILGVTLAAYVFVESFLGSSRDRWSFYLTLLLIPMAVGVGILWIVHHRYGKGDRLLLHA